MGKLVVAPRFLMSPPGHMLHLTPDPLMSPPQNTPFQIPICRTTRSSRLSPYIPAPMSPIFLYQPPPIYPSALRGLPLSRPYVTFCFMSPRALCRLLPYVTPPGSTYSTFCPMSPPFMLHFAFISPLLQPLA